MAASWGCFSGVTPRASPSRKAAAVNFFNPGSLSGVKSDSFRLSCSISRMGRAPSPYPSKRLMSAKGTATRSGSRTQARNASSQGPLQLFR